VACGLSFPLGRWRWRLLKGPLYEKTPTDQRIEADFRLIAQQVLAQPASDDPVEIEARTDRALSTTIGLNALSKCNTGKSSLTSSVLLAGHGAIAAPLPETAGVGIVDAHREGRRYIVHSDELMTAFLELEVMLL